MTDSEWLSITDPEKLWTTVSPGLDFLSLRGSRKLRLFGCACIRSVWQRYLDDDDSIRACLVVAENYADDKATEEELNMAYDVSRDLWNSSDSVGDPPTYGIGSVRAEIYTICRSSALLGIRNGVLTKPYNDPERICYLMREVLAPVLRPEMFSQEPIPTTPLIQSLAEAAYKEQADNGELTRDRFLILSDALEEADCQNLSVLNHLRQPTAHCRGCWALDLVRGY